MSYGNNYGGGGGYAGQGGYSQQSGGYSQGNYNQGSYNQAPYGQGGLGGGQGYGGGSNNNAYGGNSNQGSYGGAQGYNQSSNPYGQSGAQYNQAPAANPYNQNAYNQNAYNAPAPGEYSDNVEMGAMNGGGIQKDSIFVQCRDIQNSIKKMRESGFKTLSDRQKLYFGNPGPDTLSAVDVEQESIDHTIQELQHKLKRLMTQPGVSQDDRTEIKRTLDQLKELSTLNFQKNNEFIQQKRQARIRNVKTTHPELRTDEDVANYVDNMAPGEDERIYASSILQANRRGQAQTALGNVQTRHEEITKINAAMIQLAQLFEETNALVVQQETQVAKIEEQAQNVEQDVGQANVQLDGAIVKARAARRKKWICLGIVVAIVLIVVIIVLAWGYGTHTFDPKPAQPTK